MINEMNAYAYCKEDISKIENYDKAINGVRVRNKEADK